MLAFEGVLFVKWLDILPIGLTDENFVLADGSYELRNIHYFNKTATYCNHFEGITHQRLPRGVNCIQMSYYKHLFCPNDSCGPRGWVYFHLFPFLDKANLRGPKTHKHTRYTTACKTFFDNKETVIAFNNDNQPLNLYHYILLDIIPLHSILLFRKLGRQKVTVLVTDTMGGGRPTIALNTLMKPFVKKIVMLSNVQEPLCINNLIVRNHNSWNFPKGISWHDKRHRTITPVKSLLSLPDTILNFYNLAKDAAAGGFITYMRRTDLVRSVLNVNELYASLRNKFGAESLQVANFNRNVTMLEQIGLIRRTNILIGVHGAGMTHMIWMPPFKSSILEIYPVMTEKEDPHKGVYSPHTIERCVLGTCSVYFNMARSFGIKHYSYFETIDEKKRADDVLSKIDIRRRGGIYINAVDVVSIVSKMKEELG